MRPAIRRPLNTRDGVADAPIEPGLRMLCEPCVFGPRLKLCRLIVPAKPLPIPIPETLTRSPGSNVSTVTASPGVSSVVPRNSTSLTRTIGHGPASITVTGVTSPVSSSKTCVIPSFFPTIPFIPASELDLDVDAGREVEPHQRVDRLRGRRVDVDQPLVRAHLEVLARVLVLERAADHAVDVLLGGQGDRPSDRRAASLRGVDDLLGRLVHLLVVIALQPDSDLLLWHRRPP